MKKTSASVLALLFASVAAQTTDASAAVVTDAAAAGTGTDFTPAGNDYTPADLPHENTKEPSVIETIESEVQTLIGSTKLDETVTWMEMNFKSYSQFTIYANGNEIGSSSGRMYDPYFSGDAEILKIDSIAIEMLGYPGLAVMMMAEFNNMATSDDGWVCRDIDVLPEGWNLNAYDDQTWDKALHLFNNSDKLPFMMRPDPLFADDNVYIGTDELSEPHLLCRYNQVSYEERAQANGMCDDEMSAFEMLMNKMIAHHREETTKYNADISQKIEDLSIAAGINGELEVAIANEMAKFESTVEAHNAAVLHLEETWNTKHNSMITYLEETCEVAVNDMEKITVAEWENTLIDAEELHASIQATQATTHSDALLAAQEKAAAEQKAALKKREDDLHAKWLEEERLLRAGLADQHEKDVADRLFAAAEAQRLIYEGELARQEELHEGTIVDLTNVFDQATSEAAKGFGDEIDRLTRKHDYLYESCTTVQVVNGELVVGA